MCGSNGAMSKVSLQEELADGGYHHIQGYLAFTKKTRPIEVFRTRITHWEVARNPKASIAYTRKVESKVPNGISYDFGLPRRLVSILPAQLNTDQRKIFDELGTPAPPNSRTVKWYWEAKGNWGKTFLTKCIVDNLKAVVLSGSAKDALYGVASFVEKRGEGPDVVVFDIPRCTADFVSFQAIEKVKDGLFFSPKYESCQVRYNTPHVICFSNGPPDTTKLSEDRWDIVHLREKEVSDVGS